MVIRNCCKRAMLVHTALKDMRPERDAVINNQNESPARRNCPCSIAFLEALASLDVVRLMLVFKVKICAC